MNGGGNYCHGSSCKTWPNAGKPEYPAVLARTIDAMSSDNPSGADNQQERLDHVLPDVPDDLAWYIVGFTDGEGSFNASFGISSRILRDYTPGAPAPRSKREGDEIVRPAWRHAEPSRNDSAPRNFEE